MVYGIRIEYTFLDALAVLDRAREKGLGSFCEEGLLVCCRARMALLLKKIVGTLKVRIDMKRKDESHWTRSNITCVDSRRLSARLHASCIRSSPRAWKSWNDDRGRSFLLHFPSLCSFRLRQRRPGSSSHRLTILSTFFFVPSPTVEPSTPRKAAPSPSVRLLSVRGCRAREPETWPS